MLRRICFIGVRRGIVQKRCGKMTGSSESAEMELNSIDNQIESLDAEIQQLGSKKRRLLDKRKKVKQKLDNLQLERLSTSTNWSSQTSFPWSETMDLHFRNVFGLSQYRPHQVCKNIFSRGEE